MKIYILLDTYLNMEQHCDFIDVFDDADELLKYIEKNQSDGHKFEVHTKEVKEHPFVSPTSPQPLDPLKSSETYPLGITWAGIPCMNGGPCTNPQHDCINCPWLYGGGTYTTSPDSTGYRISVVKCTQVSKSGTDSVNSESYDGMGTKSKDLKTE